eukprot:14259845-Alexandrium_andersonii.AAC.2
MGLHALCGALAMAVAGSLHSERAPRQRQNANNNGNNSNSNSSSSSSSSLIERAALGRAAGSDEAPQRSTA